MKRKIELTLPATLKLSSLVRQIATDVFDYAGFTKEWVSRLKLVVDELFMNANRYASKEDESKIYIEFEYDEDSVVFRIDDEGAGNTKVTAEDLKKKVADNKESTMDLTKTCGRGLALISDLWTDEVVIVDSPRGGISISFSKKITAEAPPAPPMPNIASQSVPAPKKKEATPVVPQGPTEVIKVVGEVDSSNVEEKAKPIQKKVDSMPEGGILVIDCAELIYFNSTFIGYLAGWHNMMLANNGQLVLKHVNSEVKDVLDLVGLSHVIYMES
jgi:anti-anti-sigma factor